MRGAWLLVLAMRMVALAIILLTFVGLASPMSVYVPLLPLTVAIMMHVFDSGSHDTILDVNALEPCLVGNEEQATKT